MSEPTLVMKLTALRDYVMVLGVSEDDCEVFDEAVEALYNARSAALEEAARVADEHMGAAERKRHANGMKLGRLSQDAQERILAEECGEDIASDLIAKAIRALKDKDTRTPTEVDLL